jgi:hypothetical protein
MKLLAITLFGWSVFWSVLWFISMYAGPRSADVFWETYFDFTKHLSAFCAGLATSLAVGAWTILWWRA